MAVGALNIMGEMGHMEIKWDSDNEDQVNHARETFNQFVNEKQYLAFRSRGEGEKGEQIQRFDSEHEEIILTPRMVGG